MEIDFHSRMRASDNHRDFLFRREVFFVPLGALLLMALQFQTTPAPFEVQIIPLTSLLALAFLPFIMYDIRRSPLLIAMGIFVGYVLIHSLMLLVIDLVAGEPALRFFSWLRQFAALLAGFSVFLLLRETVQHLSDRQVARYIVWGSLPALLLGLVNILWGGFQQKWAGAIVTGVRSVVAPLGYTAPLRASGFSQEPATFAAVIVIVLFPILFYMYEVRYRMWKTAIYFGVVVLAFVWTFSVVGVALFAALVAVGILFGPRRRLFRRTGMVALLVLVAGLTLIPSNQILRHGRSIVQGQSNVSFIDRYYGLIGPFLMSFQTYTVFGYGLGGTVSHFDEVLPKEVQSAVASVKWKELPNLSTLIGRIYAETGAIGFAFFLGALAMTFWEFRRSITRTRNPGQKAFLTAARLGFILACVASAMTLGSFHMPYLWLWMAVLDARFLQLKDEELEGKTPG